MRPSPKDCVVLPPASMNLRRTAGQLADGESFGIVQLRLNILNTANLSCQWPCDPEKQAFLVQRPAAVIPLLVVQKSAPDAFRCGGQFANGRANGIVDRRENGRTGSDQRG